MSKSDITTIDRFRFQRSLERLQQLEGRGTELVTVYIPPNKQIHEVMNDLRNEYGTAENIKSKPTRKNVQDALTRAMERLKLFRSVPINGLAIFSGNIQGDNERNEEMVTYVVEPPEPINTYYYRCEHKFMLDPLFQILETDEVYGIVVIDAKDATFAILKGERANIIKEVTSGVPGKTRAGGQSARRYERLRRMHLNEYFNRLGNYFTEIYLNQKKLKGIILGGPGPTKEDFLNGSYLHYEIKDRILTTVDTGYTGPEGVKEVVNRSRSFLEKVRYFEERKVVQEFLQHLGEDDGLVTYGEQDVLKQLRNVNVYKLLISQEVRRWYVKLVCSICGTEEIRIVDFKDWESFEEKIQNLNCLQCGEGKYSIKERVDFIEKLIKMGEEAKAEIEVISSYTEEGEMLNKSFGGVAAITRYRTY
jgi:peptide chain release factor subunit 1